MSNLYYSKLTQKYYKSQQFNNFKYIFKKTYKKSTDLQIPFISHKLKQKKLIFIGPVLAQAPHIYIYVSQMEKSQSRKQHISFTNDLKSIKNYNNYQFKIFKSYIIKYVDSQNSIRLTYIGTEKITHIILKLPKKYYK